MHYELHATEVVNRFKEMLSDEALKSVSEEHFSELETLLVAALGVVDSQAKHDFAKQVEALAHELRLKSSNVG